MAVTVAFFGLTVEKIAEQAGNDVNFLTGTVKSSLHTNTWTPDRDTHDFFDDATNELAGNGYAQQTLASKTITYDSASDQIRWDAADVTFPFNASSTWRYGVLWIDTAGAASTDPLYALLTWDADQSVSTPYTLTWDAAGILYIDTT